MKYIITSIILLSISCGFPNDETGIHLSKFLIEKTQTTNDYNSRLKNYSLEQLDKSALPEGENPFLEEYMKIKIELENGIKDSIHIWLDYNVQDTSLFEFIEHGLIGLTTDWRFKDENDAIPFFNESISKLSVKIGASNGFTISDSIKIYDKIEVIEPENDFDYEFEIDLSGEYNSNDGSLIVLEDCVLNYEVRIRN